MTGLGWWVCFRARLNERGASVVEYALLIALIALVCFAATEFLGNQTSTQLSSFGNSLGTGS
jgi:pilus assembly protein Flp/PilA